MRKLLITLLTIAATTTIYAQSGTNSPYSMYGVGVLNDRASGFNRAMSGLGIALHEGNQVDYLNPASYSNMDSLTFIFDAGMTLQFTNFTSGSVKKNAKNADFEYAVAGFRVAKHLGMSFGVLPFSNVGYSFSATDKYTDNTAHTAGSTYTTTNSGTGGLRQIYLGAGYSPFKGFSVGLNVGYIWGEYSRSIVTSYSDGYSRSGGRYYTADAAAMRFDLGLQYTQQLDKDNSLTLGLTFSPGYKMSSTADMKEILTDPQTSVSDTAKYSLKNSIPLPTQFGVGLAWYHTTRWRVGVDYTLQKWGSFPDYVNCIYANRDDVLLDRHKVIIGGEYVPNAQSRKYLNRIHIRAGLSYATPYININSEKGPKEYGATLGFGLPITNSWNNRSVLNISAQYVRTDGPIKENTFRLNIGLTFNERWFQKWKVE